MPNYSPRHPTVNVVQPPENSHATDNNADLGKSRRALMDLMYMAPPDLGSVDIVQGRLAKMLENRVVEPKDRAAVSTYYGFSSQLFSNLVFDDPTPFGAPDKLANGEGAASRVEHPDGDYDLPSPLGPNLSVREGKTERQLIEEDLGATIPKFSPENDGYAAVRAAFSNPVDFSTHGAAVVYRNRYQLGKGSHGQ